MKTFFVLASLAASALAQRLHITEPTANQNLKSAQNFTVQLLQDVSRPFPSPRSPLIVLVSQQTLGPLEPGSVTIAVVSCLNACDKPDQWAASTVLYDGAFNPQGGAKGHTQDFQLTLPTMTPGKAVVSVAHEFREGGVSTQLASVLIQPLMRGL